MGEGGQGISSAQFMDFQGLGCREGSGVRARRKGLVCHGWAQSRVGREGLFCHGWGSKSGKRGQEVERRMTTVRGGEGWGP
eukprot:366092-Chlamydomonas_euryale.AAC.4